MKILWSVLIAGALVYCAGATARTPAPDGAGVYIIAPADGAMVASPVTVRFGLKGMGVAPAGTSKAGTGHHHLLLDAEKLPNMDQPIPSDQWHRHFGGGQTETIVKLGPGRHTLQLLLGDMNHIPHAPAIKSKRITITVK